MRRLGPWEQHQGNRLGLGDRQLRRPLQVWLRGDQSRPARCWVGRCPRARERGPTAAEPGTGLPPQQRCGRGVRSSGWRWWWPGGRCGAATPRRRGRRGCADPGSSLRHAKPAPGSPGPAAPGSRPPANSVRPWPATRARSAGPGPQTGPRGRPPSGSWACGPASASAARAGRPHPAGPPGPAPCRWGTGPPNRPGAARPTQLQPALARGMGSQPSSSTGSGPSW